MKTRLLKILLPRCFTRLLVIGLLCLELGLPLFAGEKYLAPNQPDGIALLTPPPAPGSAEQTADLAAAREVFKTASPAEKNRAEKDASLSIYNFAPVIGEFFQAGKFPKVDLFFEQVKTNISSVINSPKDHWKRQRPYQLDKSLELGKPEKSFSYPSGHSTRGTVQSLLLAELFPERREPILEFGRTIGWDRIIIGKHFPTDVYAGRVLGQAIVRELKKSADFQRDFAAAKAEVEAARNGK